MPTSVAPTRFDPNAASADEWARFHAFRRQRQAEVFQDEPAGPDRLAEIGLKRGDSETITDVLWTADGGEVSSVATFWSPKPGGAGYDSNRGILWFELYVLKGHRGRGIASSYLPALLELAERNEGKVVGVTAEDQDGHAAVQAFGFAKKSEERYSRLDLLEVDWEQVGRWLEDGPRRSPSRTLQLYTNWPPEEEWPEYARVVTELFNTIPFDEEEHGEITITPAKLAEMTHRMAVSDGRVLSIVVREEDGRITALTEMALWEEQADYAWQWLTAVHRSVQGNRIGRWIKAAMLTHVREHHPSVRWVMTGNASSNAPMLKINTELGFRPYRSTSAYQMSMADFAAAVAQRTKST
jgi:mycothiol synthase